MSESPERRPSEARLPYLLLLVSAVSLGGVALAGVELTRTIDASQEAMAVAAEEQTSAERLLWLRERTSRKVRSYLLTGNSRYLREQAEAEDAFRATLTSLERTMRTPDQRAMLAEVRRADDERHRVTAQLFELHRRGRQAELQEGLERDLQPVLDRIDPAVGALVERAEFDLRQVQRDAESRASKAQRLLWFSLAVAAAVAGLASRALLRHVRRVESQAEVDRRARDRFFDLSMDVVCIAGADGYFKQLNPALELLTGHARAELLAQPFVHFVHPDDVARTQAETARLATGVPSVDFENRYRCKDGTYRWLSWRCQPEAGGLLYAVARDVTVQRAAAEQLATTADEMRLLSVSDELTGLSNRRGFVLLAEQALKQAERDRGRPLLFFIDLDGLKRINDTLGHEFGDRAICEASEALRASFRVSDIVARMGGDEFVALVSNPDAGPVLEERLRTQVAQVNAREGRAFTLAMSVGWVSFDPSAPESVDELLQRADAAMYEQKAAHTAARG